MGFRKIFQKMESQINKKLIVSFLLTIIILTAYTYRPVYPSYLYLKFSSLVDGSSYLYINGNERLPIVGIKTIEGNNTVKFGPIMEDIKLIRIDPIYNKNVGIELEEIYLKNEFGKIYEYDINNTNKWEFHNAAKIEIKDNKNILIESNNISPLILINNQIIKLTGPMDIIFNSINNFLSKDKLIINFIAFNLFLAIFFIVNKKFNLILSIILTLCWFLINIEIYSLTYSLIKYEYTANSPIGIGIYNGININSSLYSYISIIIFNVFFYKILRRL